MLNPQLRVYFLEKMKKQTQMLRKWGGLIIAVGALLPLPFAIASLAAGMIKYDFKAFLLFALLRFLRFAIYGFAIYQMI
jgi:membrane protein DedA with SNARE-associated domain